MFSSALKCLALVDALSEFSEPVPLSMLARAVGEGRSTVFKRLSTLVEAGWVEKTENGHYSLSLRTAAIGARALEQASLGQRVLPAIQQLSAEVQETVSIIVLDRHESLIAQRVESGQVLRADLRVGALMPIAENASGQVLVAFASPARRAQLVSDGVVLPSEETLERVRARGASFASLVPRVTAIAVPIFGVHGYAEAALSVAGPAERFDPESVEELVKETACRLTVLAGGRPTS